MICQWIASVWCPMSTVKTFHNPHPAHPPNSIAWWQIKGPARSSPYLLSHPTRKYTLGTLEPNTKKKRRSKCIIWVSFNLDQLALELISFRQKWHLTECWLAVSGELMSRDTPEAWNRNRTKLIPMMLTSLLANDLSKGLVRSQTFGGVGLD